MFDHEPASNEEVSLVGRATVDELAEAFAAARRSGLAAVPDTVLVMVAYLAYDRLALRLREEVGLREPWEAS